MSLYQRFTTVAIDKYLPINATAYDVRMHDQYIRRCLDLASLGRGKVGNGAMVGAVLIRGDKVIAEAFHGGFGLAHAEVELLESFRGPIEPQDVLYVNLEPCCHQGKTPPCTEVITKKGIKNLVFGMLDPDQRVSGKGIEQLKSNDISVIGPVGRALCEWFNRGFVSVRTKTRPWITVKMAQDRAGSICHTDGSSKKITSQDQDAWSHTYLRGTHDAIVVGVQSVISDNPLLNRRFDQSIRYSHMEGLNEISKEIQNSFQPYKIILDPQGRIPTDARVISQDQERTLLCVSNEHRSSSKTQELQRRGVRIVSLPMDGDVFDWRELWNALTTPQGSFHGITSILVEGGRKTWKAFSEARCIDEHVTLVGSR